MASAQGVRAGRAYVEISASNNLLFKGLKDAEARVRAFGKVVGNLGSRIGAIGSGISGLGLRLGGIGAAALAPFGLAIRAAGNLIETVSKLEAVFKDQSGGVKEWAGTFAKAVGRSKVETMDALANVGAVLSGFGFVGNALADTSEKVAALGVDLASFFNASDEEAIHALISGLTGETEPLKRFGVVLLDTKVKAELLNRSIDPENASDAQRAMARLALIYRSTRDAQGDATRTAGSFNNQMKNVTGQLKDLAVTIGQALLPSAAALLATFKGYLAPVAAWIGANREAVVAVAKAAAGIALAGVALVGLGGVLSAAGVGVTALATAIGAAAGVLGLLASPIGLVGAGLVALAAATIDWRAVTGAALGFIGGKWQELKATALGAWADILAIIKAGDLALAGRIAMTGFEVAWRSGLSLLQHGWTESVAFVKNAWSVLWGEAEKIFINTWAFLQSAWVQGVGGLADAFAALGPAISAILRGVVANAVGAFAAIKNALLAGLDPAAALKQFEALAAGAAARAAAGRQKSRQEQLDEIERQRQAGIRRVDVRVGGEVAGHRAEADQAEAGGDDALAKAKKAFEAAREEARALAGGPGVGGFRAADLLGDDQKKKAGLTAEGIQAGLKGVESRGGFSASQGTLGIGGVAEEQLEEQKKANKLLERQNNQLGDIRRNGRLVMTP